MCAGSREACSWKPDWANPVLTEWNLVDRTDRRPKDLVTVRGARLFAFNFHHEKSYVDYGVLVPPGTRWRRLLDTDERRFGGQGRIAADQVFVPQLVPAHGELVTQIRVYLPSRTALVLKLEEDGS